MAEESTPLLPTGHLLIPVFFHGICDIEDCVYLCLGRKGRKELKENKQQNMLYFTTFQHWLNLR